MLVIRNVPANAANVKDTSSIPGWGRAPGKGNGNPLQYSSLENPHGQWSLVGYSPWGCKESDMTEQLPLIKHNKHSHGKVPHHDLQ